MNCIFPIVFNSGSLLISTEELCRKGIETLNIIGSKLITSGFVLSRV